MILTLSLEHEQPEIRKKKKPNKWLDKLTSIASNKVLFSYPVQNKQLNKIQNIIKKKKKDLKISCTMHVLIQECLEPHKN